MKNIKVLSLLFILVSNFSFPQWQSLNMPPASGSIKKLAQHPEGYIFAAGVMGKIYRSDSNGNNFQYINSIPEVNSMAISPKGKLFAGCSGGYYSSSDIGVNWEHTTLLTTGYVSDFQFDSSGAIFLSTCNDTGPALRRSSDQGITWEPVGFYGNIVSFVKDSMGYFFAATSDLKLYKSTDRGFSWNSIYVYSPPRMNCIKVGKDNALYLDYGYIKKSTDEGVSWQGFASNNLSYNTFIDPDNRIYSLTSNGITFTTNNGNNWISRGLININTNDLLFYKNSTFAATDFGLLRAELLDSNWTPYYLNTDGSIANRDIVVLNSGKIIIGSDHGVYTSTDNGISWIWTLKSPVKILKKDTDEIIYATDLYRIFRSTNKGSTWEEKTSAFSKLVDFYIDDLNRVYTAHYVEGYNMVGIGASAYMSINKGDTWMKLYAHQEQFQNYINTAIGANRAGDIFVCMISADFPYLMKVPDNYLRPIPSLNHIYYWKDTMYMTTGPSEWDIPYGIMKSYDGGYTFLRFNNGLVNTGIRNLCFVSNTTLFCVTGDGALYYSSDYANNWNKINADSVAPNGFLDLDINGRDIFCIGGNYLFKYGDFLTNVDHQNKNYSYSFLKQNYPNPFNLSTIMEYGIEFSGEVVIKIYNTLGEETKIINEGYKSAGTHKVEFNAIGLPSGIYYYQVKAGSFYSKTSKMVLLK